MIPLINIVFLLLIFFMVAGQLREFSGELNLPTANTDQPPSTSTLKIQIDATGQLYADGVAITIEDLETYFSGKTTADKIKIALQVDRAITASQLDPTLNVLRAQAVGQITLYTQQGQPES